MKTLHDGVIIPRGHIDGHGDRQSGDNETNEQEFPSPSPSPAGRGAGKRLSCGEGQASASPHGRGRSSAARTGEGRDHRRLKRPNRIAYIAGLAPWAVK